MKMVLLLTGKTDQSWIRDGVAEYEKRISKYGRLEIITLPDVKNPGNRPADWVKAKEAERILPQLRGDDHVVLLDERGRLYSTLEMAEWVRKTMMLPAKRVVFVIGGPYGFDPAITSRADQLLSLSRLTFSHQVVRLLFAEQLYRVLSVNAGDPYHHE
ncbi:MAG: 23S rRNA (pseudouridine(1915)-N(3))-methyltransferase RlmH [Bacteroidales bacterium]|jgi:23S rRNA (pseudouridine1915-N3)-methyltransferase|nr:23S rRNA (pseudouridine(1915)-N(3))-methyltransferase RlmH [Bacteroidales bacterium]